MRSRLLVRTPGVDGLGITSACAEQTEADATPTTPERDHLRVCGADDHGFAMMADGAGSPPRVRSRRCRVVVGLRGCGITSACAEQTACTRSPSAPHWDHLRVCGADTPKQQLRPLTEGSPPRVRSRLSLRRVHLIQVGITSACAEQTNNIHRPYQSGRDHLRVCGADSHYTRQIIRRSGSPPRVRSRLMVPDCEATSVGITSACAEQTSW